MNAHCAVAAPTRSHDSILYAGGTAFHDFLICRHTDETWAVADIKVVSDLDATYTAAYLSDFTIKGAGWSYLDGTVATTTTCGSSQVIGGYPILAKDGSLLKTISNLESHSAYF